MLTAVPGTKCPIVYRAERVNFIGDFEGVFDLNTEVSHRTLNPTAQAKAVPRAGWVTQPCSRKIRPWLRPRFIRQVRRNLAPADSQRECRRIAAIRGFGVYAGAVANKEFDYSEISSEGFHVKHGPSTVISSDGRLAILLKLLFDLRHHVHTHRMKKESRHSGCCAFAAEQL